MPLDMIALEKSVAEAKEAIAGAVSLAELDAVASRHGGKKSALAAANQSLREIPAEERPEAGRVIGELRSEISRLVDERRRELATQAESARLEGERIDVTLPGVSRPVGHEHILTRTTRELVDIFVGMGYQVAEGNEIDTDYYNFEALNIPKYHPARSMQDTLYVDSGRGEEILLRTQTSGVQIHYMEAHEPPLYMVAPGRVFRQEELDPSHSPVFHQIEGLAVDRGLSLADLAGTLRHFIREYFGADREIKIRPSYFPFTEPSVEVAMTCFICAGVGCRTCGQAGWIEVLGAGMVDPNVFEAVGYDPEEWSGFAFGLGVDRTALLRHGIPDIRFLFENDLRFLSQF